jgi:hypothetical protein
MEKAQVSTRGRAHLCLPSEVRRKTSVTGLVSSDFAWPQCAADPSTLRLHPLARAAKLRPTPAPHPAQAHAWAVLPPASAYGGGWEKDDRCMAKPHQRMKRGYGWDKKSEGIRKR